MNLSNPELNALNTMATAIVSSPSEAMGGKNIQILRMTYLGGPSIWTYQPVIEALIDIGELEDFPSNTLPGFNDRLKAWLPDMVEHRCTPGVRGGFFQRLDSGTWAGHILEHVALELQTRAGMPMGFGKAREAGPRGVYKVIVRTDHEEVGKFALLAARELILAAIHDSPFDVPGTIAQLTDMVDSLWIGPSTASIVQAAIDRRIPFIRLNAGNLVQLGYGNNQRRIWTAETDSTSAIAEGISKDKDLTKKLLAMCGVPVPEGQVVNSAAAAWVIAQELGLPVCVKPSDGNRARGVSLELHSQADIEAAYDIALKQGSEVIVERFIRGAEHRLLVVGDRVVAASRGETASVVGDGKHTMRELVALQINSDPRRGSDGNLPLESVRLRGNSPEVLELARQGLTPDCVPVAMREVLVKRTGNMTMDVTDTVHPDVAAQVALAARIVGLDIAGVDLVVQDISKPLKAQGGAIIEVNAGPSLLMHLNPASGKAQQVGEAIALHLFPNNEAGRIPVVGLMGDGDTTGPAKLIAWLLHLKGLQTGLACACGLFLGNRRLQKKSAMDWDTAQRLLINRAAQAAVFESTARHLLTEGLPYDRCQVGLVTSMPPAQGLQDLYIHSDDQMPGLVRTQIDVVLPTGAAVLNAQDAQVVALAQYSDGEVIYYAQDENNPTLQAHRAENGKVVFARQDQVIWAQGPKETEIFSLAASTTSKMLKTHHLSRDDLLAAASAAWALDISKDLIRAGVKSFGQSPTAH
jgi:cyanophycin synthetase